MRHRVAGRILSRNTKQRKSLLKGLANSVILNEKVTTTEAKAKAIRPYLEKLVTISKADSLQARRRLIAKLGLQNSVNKLLEVIGPTFKDRSGGYLRITRLVPRAGDAARMVVVEFVEELSVPPKEVKEKIKAKELKIKVEKKPSESKKSKTIKKVKVSAKKKENGKERKTKK